MHMLEECPIQIRVYHVKSHVTESERENNQLALMNEDMDELAKSYLKHCIEQKSLVSQLDFHSIHWSLRINNKKIVRHLDKHIVNWIHGTDLKKFLMSKKRLTTKTESMIDWAALS